MNLGHRLRQHVILEPVPREEMDAHSRSNTTRSALSLQSVCSGLPNRIQTFHVPVRVKVFFLHLARINHKNTIVYSYRSFCNVGRKNDFSDTFAWRSEKQCLPNTKNGQKMGKLVKNLANLNMHAKQQQQDYY